MEFCDEVRIAKAFKNVDDRLKALEESVNIVRCKECKHRPIKPDDYNPITTDGFALEFPDEKCPCQCSDGWYSKYPDDDWFCADGDRKGGVNDG